IEIGYENAIAPADAILIVATPELTSIRDADRILKDAVGRNISRRMLIINKVRSDLIKKGILPGIDYMLGILKADIIGILHYSEQIFIATNKGVPIASITHSKYYKIFEEIASRIMGIEKPLFND
ncbi:MAG: septum site-determining protein MinD, partial [Peptostreptococcales bacterium]